MDRVSASGLLSEEDEESFKKALSDFSRTLDYLLS
jgi:hypothetical protein